MGRGVQSWLKECKVCGRIYHQTNFMWRQVELPNGQKFRADTHEIGCNRWRLYVVKNSGNASE